MALDKTLPIVCIFALGLLLKRLQVLKREHAPLLSALVLRVALPATIINSLASAKLSPNLLLLPVSGLLISTALLGLGFVVAPILCLQGTTRGSFLMAFPSFELGSIGYAFMLAVYGPDGLTRIAILDLGSGFFFFTVCALLASIFGRSAQRFQLSDALMQCMRNPMIWSYGIGLALNMFAVHSALMSNLLTAVSQALLLLIMLLIAIEVDFREITSISRPLLALYFKMSIGVILGLFIALLFGFTGMTRIALILGASLPSSLMSIVYAREHALDVRFLATELSLALPIAIGSSSLILFLSH
jgi:predicted permease